MKHSKKEKDKDKDNSDIENKKAEKINQDDNYLSYNVLKEILTECKIPKRIIEEKNLTTESLISEINSLINNEEELKEIKSNLKKLEVFDAGEKIYNEIEKLVK